tara:strand:+ start:759 stop:968 length:210 start_codon:yes stop_codon:yes gene_type:complete
VLLDLQALTPEFGSVLEPASNAVIDREFEGGDRETVGWSQEFAISDGQPNHPPECSFSIPDSRFAFAAA